MIMDAINLMNTQIKNKLIIINNNKKIKECGLKIRWQSIILNLESIILFFFKKK